MEDVEDDVPLSDCLHMKRTHPSVRGRGSGSTIVGEELNTFSTLAMPLNVTPLITEYPISDDDEPGKFVAIDVASLSRPDKKRKNAKAKKIVDDASVADGSGTSDPLGLGNQDAQAVFPGPQDVVGVACWIPPPTASSAKAYLESILLHTRVARFPQVELDLQVRHLKETIDRVTVEKEKSFQTMKANKAEVARRHSKEVIGLQGRIAELEAEVRRANDDLALDGGVATRVSKEGATLYARSWPYLLELVKSRDEDMSDLLAIRDPPDVYASSSLKAP
ncbi:hypothetical protein Tco_0685153 [Tanacetum coccineum]